MIDRLLMIGQYDQAAERFIGEMTGDGSRIGLEVLGGEGVVVVEFLEKPVVFEGAELAHGSEMAEEGGFAGGEVEIFALESMQGVFANQRVPAILLSFSRHVRLLRAALSVAP